MSGPKPVIGYLSGGNESNDERSGFGPAFRKGLGQQGYVAGRNVEILYRWQKTGMRGCPCLQLNLCAAAQT